MNDKQKKFAELYAANPNATEAAKGAGYSERTARSQGQRLLTNVDIKKYISELHNAAASERILSLAEIKAFWSDTTNDKSEKMSDRLKASALLARSAGAFLGNVKITSEFPVADVSGDDVIIYMPRMMSEDECLVEDEDTAETEDEQ